MMERRQIIEDREERIDDAYSFIRMEREKKKEMEEGRNCRVSN